MTRIMESFLCFVLILPASLVGQQSEIRQVPPNPSETIDIYAPGVRPFLWSNHGARPYFPVPSREELVKLSQKEGLINDLLAQDLTREQAEFVKNALANANDPSQISETVLPIDTGIQNMRDADGIKPMVIVKGSPVEAYQIILPPELGSLVVWIPKVCGNICLSVMRAQSMRITFSTDVKERIVEKIVEKQVPVIVEKEVLKEVIIEKPPTIIEKQMPPIIIERPTVKSTTIIIEREYPVIIEVEKPTTVIVEKSETVILERKPVIMAGRPIIERPVIEKLSPPKPFIYLEEIPAPPRESRCGRRCKIALFVGAAGAAAIAGVVLTRRPSDPPTPYKSPGGGGGVD